MTCQAVRHRHTALWRLRTLRKHQCHKPFHPSSLTWQIKPESSSTIRWCCSYLSSELGVNQWPLTLEKCCDRWRESGDRDSARQIPLDWDVHHGRLQSKPQRLHHLVSKNHLSNHVLVVIWFSIDMKAAVCYFGLHPVGPCDELSVASSFFGQPVDESRTGPFPDPKGETPTTQWAGFYTPST